MKIISEENLSVLLDYLSTRPWKEVDGAIKFLTQLETLPNLDSSDLQNDEDSVKTNE